MNRRHATIIRRAMQIPELPPASSGMLKKLYRAPLNTRLTPYQKRALEELRSAHGMNVPSK